MISKRGFLQVSFGWLFAVIIGAIIIFFAIYASVKLINTEEAVTSTETGREIAVLLNPLETGFGEERSTLLSIAVESRLGNICNEFGDFGEQEISVAQRISGEYRATNINPIFYNKYIFSKDSVEGKNFYLFSKPLVFPFNVADLIFLTEATESYCFVGAPSNIEQELEDLSQDNLLTSDCGATSIRICFRGQENNCDVRVNVNEKSVTKGTKKVYYETDTLMYGAIFSEPEIYECQVKRLMQRLESLAVLYNNKEGLLVNRGCTQDVSLLGLAGAASGLKDSSNLINVKTAVEDADSTNKRAYCELW